MNTKGASSREDSHVPDGGESPGQGLSTASGLSQFLNLMSLVLTFFAAAGSLGLIWVLARSPYPHEGHNAAFESLLIISVVAATGVPAYVFSLLARWRNRRKPEGTWPWLIRVQQLALWVALANVLGWVVAPILWALLVKGWAWVLGVPR